MRKSWALRGPATICSWFSSHTDISLLSILSRDHRDPAHLHQFKLPLYNLNSLLVTSRQTSEMLRRYSSDTILGSSYTPRLKPWTDWRWRGWRSASTRPFSLTTQFLVRSQRRPRETAVTAFSTRRKHIHEPAAYTDWMLPRAPRHTSTDAGLLWCLRLFPTNKLKWPTAGITFHKWETCLLIPTLIKYHRYLQDAEPVNACKCWFQHLHLPLRGHPNSTQIDIWWFIENHFDMNNMEWWCPCV